MSVSDDALVIMGRGKGTSIVGEDSFATNDHGNLHRLLVQHLLVLGKLGFSLWASRTVRKHGFILGIGDLEKCVRHGCKSGVKGSGRKVREKVRSFLLKNRGSPTRLSR